MGQAADFARAMNIILGLGLTTLCLALQALAGAVGVKWFAALARQPHDKHPRSAAFGRFAALMLVLMLGNIMQIVAWALLYQGLDAFEDFYTAIYFSGVTFTALGYGDIVLAPELRLLAPLQAANGLTMFGITTALFIGAVQSGRHQQR
jgi:hypothetical protein